MSCIKRRKANLIKVFGSRCCICGFDKFQEALEFHHVIPSEKKFAVASSNSITKALNAQLEEMKKCILVCANCHRGIHSGRYDVPSNWKELYNEEVAQQLRNNLWNVKHNVKRYCKICGIEIGRKAQYCLRCYRVVHQSKKRPPRDILKQMIRTRSFVSIGKEYGISDNAVRKWCIIYNLPKSKNLIKSFSDAEWEKF